jgi:hypothetical protein
MARYSNVQTDFSGGLISDYVLGRTDIKRIANSGRTFRNFFPSLQGPAIFRTGFKWYRTEDYAGDAVVSVDVVLESDEPYRVVFTPQKIEIFNKDGVSKDVLASPYSASDIEELRFSSETGELYIAHGLHKPKKLSADLTFSTATLQSSDGPTPTSHYTLQDSSGITLQTNIIVQGDDQWTLEDLLFDVEPFLDKEASNKKFTISQNERYVKLESSINEFSPVVNDPARGWYVEYVVGSQKYLGKVVDSNYTTNYTLEDPTDTTVYVEPVVSVLDVEDDAAQFYLLDSTGLASKALQLDGVNTNEIHLRSDTTVFNAGFTDSWVRVGSDRRNNDTVVGGSSNQVQWVKIKEHLGTEDHPVEFFRGVYDNSVYKSGSVYRIYDGFASGTLYMAGPDTQGAIKIVNAVLQANGNRTYTFVNTLSAANPHSTTNPPPTTGSYVIGDLSTQKQFDCVKCYSTGDGVPVVKELSPSNTTGNLIVPAASNSLIATEVANDAFLDVTESTFNVEDVDRHIFGRMSSGNVYMKIVRYVSAWKVVVKLLNPVPRDKRTLAFENGGLFEDVKLGAWYNGNYPRTVAKFEQRRIFGGTYQNANYLYFSQANDETSFQPTQDDGEVLDTDAITYALANRNAVIRWINAAKDLAIGTTGGIYRIVPNQYQYGISPKTVRMELTEEEPCEAQAEIVGSSVFYPDQSGTRLMEYKHDTTLNSASSNDVSKLIYSIFLTDAIVQIAYQHTPQPRIWARTVSGKLYCLSYHRQEEFYAWSEQDLGLNANVLDISVLHRGSDTNLDQLWIVVRRGLDVYTEALAETDPAQLTSYPMLDSYVELVKPEDGTISNDISARFGAGDTVSVVEDGAYIGDQTLTDGTVAISAQAERVIVGLRYTGELQMMFPTWDSASKPAYAAETARIVSIKLFLINTWNYMVGIKNKFETIRTSTDYGNGTGFTGFDKERPVTGSTFGVDNVPTIKHEEPYPLTIASITTKTDLN